MNEDELLKQIDALCDRYEVHLRKGEFLDFSDWLKAIPEVDRPRAFEEIFRLELEYRARNGNSISIEDLRGIYPLFQSVWMPLLEAKPQAQRNKEGRSTETFRQEQTLPTASDDPSLGAPLQAMAGSALGPYELLEMLGQGGMGAVFKARHTRLKKYVAIKVLPVHLTRSLEALARFDREMQAVGALEHPNIIRAMDANQDRGTHYLVMEYVDGQDLQKLVRENGPLPVDEACRLIRDAALALEHAHRHNLIHRDIKPSNLLLTTSGQLKVLDLGLARLTTDAGHDSGLTNTGVSLGTPDYMAPEQWNDSHTADQRTDLYALGCTLYFLLIGHAPYGTEQFRTVLGKLTAHAQAPIPPLRDSRPDVPAALEQLYQELLAKDAAKRPASATLLVERLEPFCSEVKSVTLARSAAAGQATPDAITPTRQDVRTAAATTPRSPRLWLLGSLGGLALLVVIVAIALLNSGKQQRLVDKPTDPLITPIKHPPETKTGWHGWPADAPKPAIVPFTADQAKQHQKEWADYLGVPVEWTNSIGITFRLIPPGEFEMGASPEEVEDALKSGVGTYASMELKSEAPQHRVALTQPIYLAGFEVTKAQYKLVGSESTETVTEESSPIDSTSWEDAVRFCASLSTREGLQPCYTQSLNGKGFPRNKESSYQLPSEAVWEYACRAGSLDRYGTREANAFGLHAMHGNVWEWMEDDWAEDRFAGLDTSIIVNPIVVRDGKFGITKGASYGAGQDNDRRFARRGRGPKGDVYPNVGFRVALPVESAKLLLTGVGQIDYAAERKAAEWVLDRNEGGKSVTVFDKTGKVSGSFHKISDLPAQPFTLESVYFGGEEYTSLSPLRNCRQLISLQPVGANIGDDALDVLKNFPNLHLLNLGNTKVSSRVHTYLPGITRLSVFGIGGPNYGSAEFAELPSLPTVASLKLYGNKWDALENVERCLPNLQVIDIAGSNAELEPFLRLSELDMVSCSGEQVAAPSADLSLIERPLRLEIAQPSLAALDQLEKSRPTLESLKLIFSANWDGAQPPSASFWKKLGEVKELTRLYLINYEPAEIIDTSVLATIAAMRTLERLEIVDERVGVSAVNAFQLQRPDVHLVLNGKEYPAKDPLPSVDYAAERRAAEWVLDGGKGSHVVGLLDNTGKYLGQFRNINDLPAEQFALASAFFGGEHVTSLSPLRNCKRLDSLQAVGTNIGDDALTILERFSELSNLNMGNTKVGKGIHDYLPHLLKLAHLGIGGPNYGSAEFAELPLLPQVGALELYGNKWDALENVQKCLPNLQVIDIARSNADLEPFLRLSELRLVSCSGEQLAAPSADLSLIKRPLRLSIAQPSSAALDQLEKSKPTLDSLSLDFSTNQSDGPFWQKLGEIKALKKLHLTNYGPVDIINASALEAIAAIPTLQHLEILDDRIGIVLFDAFRRKRPDVHLLLNGKDYPPTEKPE